MNITLLVSSMGSGGAERVAATLVNAWSERGDDVTLIATYSRKRPCFYALSEKVRFIHLADRVGKRRGGVVGYIERQLALRTLIRESRADVVVSFLYNVNVASVLATMGQRVPLIVCEHNDPSADGRSAFWKLATRLAYPHADAVTVLTENVVEPFRAMVPGVRHMTVLPNPLPPELFSQPAPAASVDGRLRLVSFGRLHPQKNYGLLIDAFASVAQRFAHWDLTIWGEGAERALLQARIDELGLKDRVFMPGVTNEPWLEMRRAQAFAMSSRFEGFGLALAESMALGVPAVAVDCPSGPRDITRDGQDALLVPPNDREALADALARLLGDEALRGELARKGAQSIRERYAASAILRIWDDLFARIGACTGNAEQPASMSMGSHQRQVL
ncbi:MULTISPECIES: glycosyltransferase family 4 protein [unclassified Caballeronia]|uniref:glycosyltransferase family 4 protein n=1 Tax=unclassified Caballeronia TaxID=2646786 RepID=UPI00285CD375|nr:MULTISPECIES: glycosyltransferase family 4 protein [unclassified Caballeronia]MDR5740295.1 glycosyltransferase family 4 protein [Caballeronia sp. LZ016]MDR5808525.1 glycosyltransferase family 4 protein [Caballeronia sp. LZ019]